MGADHVGSIASHLCKGRKDGAPRGLVWGRKNMLAGLAARHVWRVLRVQRSPRQARGRLFVGSPRRCRGLRCLGMTAGRWVVFTALRAGETECKMGAVCLVKKK